MYTNIYIHEKKDIHICIYIYIYMYIYTGLFLWKDPPLNMKLTPPNRAVLSQGSSTTHIKYSCSCETLFVRTSSLYRVLFVEGPSSVHEASAPSQGTVHRAPRTTHIKYPYPRKTLFMKTTSLYRVMFVEKLSSVQTVHEPSPPNRALLLQSSLTIHTKYPCSKLFL